MSEAILCCENFILSWDKGYLVAKGGYSRCKNKKKGHKDQEDDRDFFPKELLHHLPDTYNKLWYIPDMPSCQSIHVSNK